ncbi:MAG TPA: S8 family serine peptidase [Acidimicrobiales bacterium]|nr:S8 family serine peptidase [Acidimicrobiales bacterium]
MKRLTFAAAAALLLATSFVGIGTSPAAGDIAKRNARGEAFTDGRYIVTFTDEPVASYDGYERGYPATRPQPGRKLDAESPAARRWQLHLVAKHDAALASVGATKLYDYTITNNGVAAELTAAQASRLAASPGVLALHKDELAQPTTTSSPEFLGLTQAGGLWSQLGGASRAGAGVVVGIIDTGIWPESAAFAGGTGIPVPADWRGKCMAGEQFSPQACNDKLVGARYYVEGFGRRYVALEDYLSPRDGNSHGTHTASTAAGNVVNGVTVDGRQVDDGTAAGMAPGAKVAAYKVCWEGRPGMGGGCFDSDSVAAVNDAVADGVDVLNYSIGGGSESDVLDPVEQAFRAASNAGVYVAASAGNSGPGASTFDHPSPWITTVAAATFRRAFLAVELGDGQRYVGASNTNTLPTPTQIVTSLGAKLASASDGDARLCVPGTLDPAKVSGKVVQCDRGVIDRIAKSFEVQRAGGLGMVMTNTSPNSLNGDLHPIPSVHVSHTARQPVLDYITAAGATATAKIVPLTPAEAAAAPQVPEIADFSSRGPSVTTDGDLLKPDIAAPGVDVLAAVAPPFSFGRDWDMFSGTSMSSPHIAGIGALLKAAHPTWLPSEVKSAMMTSTTDTVSSGDDFFAQGAGFVQPNGAVDPGLVYPTTPNEYRRFMVSRGVQFAPPFDTLTPLSASELNLPSISVGKLAGTETVTRRVKNVDDVAATYTATVDLPGFDVVVSPSQFTLAPGAEQQFTVAFTRTDAPLNQWASGHLTWTGGGHAVRSPIALQPVVVSAPTEVRAPAGSSGSIDIDVTAGFDGTLDPTLHGLVGVTPVADSVTTGEFDFENPTPDADTDRYVVTVPAGTLAARFSLDAVDDTSDLDLFVYKDGQFVDLSASTAADEEITLRSPAPGTYEVYVNGFATPGGSTSYRLANFVVTPGDLANSDIAPDTASVTVGRTTTFTASWAGLDPAQRWLGVVTYAGTTAGGSPMAADTVTLLGVG